MENQPKTQDVGKQEEDPILAMRGVGKEIWQEEDGDSFVARERGGRNDTIKPSF
jgi:hypothetical protein